MSSHYLIWDDQAQREHKVLAQCGDRLIAESETGEQLVVTITTDGIEVRSKGLREAVAIYPDAPNVIYVKVIRR